ncbi:MAG: DUF1643 domain-containing protein [Armatimonadetes bacterium]|nr:DUF1643 domain-containing protein [Armatimonadota bacterium]
MQRDAVFDPTGAYRYSLWREWDPDCPPVAFVMLNPSTADTERDDATIRRCIGYAQRWGYGSLTAVNLFAYRCTDPRRLRQVEDPVGPENERYLLAVRDRYPTVVAAWGNWGSLHRRDEAALRLFKEKPLYCLGITKAGQPLHPLHQRGDLTPVPLPSPPLPPPPLEQNRAAASLTG